VIGVGVGQRSVGRRSTGGALTLLATLATGCDDVRVSMPEDDQLVGTVSVSGGSIFSPGECPVSGEVLLVPLEHRETLLADTLADQYDWSDEQLHSTGAWQIPLNQVEAAEGRIVPIGDQGQFLFDDVEPGPKLVCAGGDRSPSDGFRARGCVEIDVRPPMAIRLPSVEGYLQPKIVHDG
jgi:hypothetical protein